jgi:hypothetical protein
VLVQGPPDDAQAPLAMAARLRAAFAGSNGRDGERLPAQASVQPGSRRCARATVRRLGHQAVKVGGTAGATLGAARAPAIIDVRAEPARDEGRGDD